MFLNNPPWDEMTTHSTAQWLLLALRVTLPQQEREERQSPEDYQTRLLTALPKGFLHPEDWLKHCYQSFHDHSLCLSSVSSLPVSQPQFTWSLIPQARSVCFMTQNGKGTRVIH